MTQQDPVFIDIRKPPDDPLEGLANVLIGALGVAGTLVFVAAVLGLVLGIVLFWRRSRSR